ncbi:MAG TPA: diguanylate cyclase, partial [Gallionella sp.]|nr:diguanylate cyclase [Gallionella sp.]
MSSRNTKLMPNSSNSQELFRLERRTNIYKAMLEITQSIMRLSDESKLFPMICRTAVELGGVKMAWVGKLNDTSGLIEPVASYGSGSEYLENILVSADEDLPEGRGPTGTAFRESSVAVVNNYQMSEITKPWHERAALYGWKSAGSFPIQRASRPFAVLSVYYSYLDAFDDETTGLLKEISGSISFALDNLDRETQRIRALEALRKSKGEIEDLYNQAPCGYHSLDRDGVILKINDTELSWLGYTRDEIVGKMKWIDLLPQESQRVFCENFPRFKEDGSLRDLEMEVIRKDGTVFTVLINASAIYDSSGNYVMSRSMVFDITERKAAEEKILYLAHYDGLTGLPNRALFYDRLAQEIKKAHRASLKMALLFIDLDRFKEVNDTLGHGAGDTLLVEASRRIGDCMREADTVARLGGDEFTVILSEL